MVPNLAENPEKFKPKPITPILDDFDNK